MARGSCPLCGVVFSEHDAYRAHLNEVHLLFDDPGTESRLPELIALPDEPAAPDQPEGGTEPASGPAVVDVATGAPTSVGHRTSGAAAPAEAAAGGAAPAEADPAEAAPDPVTAAVEAPQDPRRTAGRGVATADREEDDGPRRWVLAAAILVSAVGLLLVGLSIVQQEPEADADEGPAPSATVPVSAEPVADEPAVAPDTHVVQPGDTLSAIAGRFGVSVEALAAENGLVDPNLIHPGQLLQLPDGRG